MRQKAELLAGEQSETSLGESSENIGMAIGDDEIEVALLREKQRRMPS